jgi:hypothetical protein
LLNLCKSCRNIDFEEIFQMEVTKNKGSHIKVLKAPAALTASNCPLCQLFSALSPSVIVETGITKLSPCHLRASLLTGLFMGQAVGWAAETEKMGSNMENKWEQEPFSKWLEETPKGRTIRLG